MQDCTRSFVIIKRDDTQHVVLIDEGDADRVLRFGTWCITQKGYVYAYRRGSSSGPNCNVYLHRFILGLSPGDPLVDHINGVKLDNRRKNLRMSTNLMNVAHQAVINQRGTSKYRGVHWRKDTQRWVASQRVNYKSMTLGCFGSEEAAAAAVSAFRTTQGLPSGY